MPTTHEATLDFGFVGKAAEFAAPIKLPSSSTAKCRGRSSVVLTPDING
jgi:hypothetical protein